MRWLGWMVPVLAAAAAVVMGPGSAAAAATYADSISGHEYAATSTRGSFAGIAPGALPGAWSATVDHTPLGTVATITGGKVYLVAYRNGIPTLVTADFTGGTVRQLSGSTGCASQRYAVNGRLGEVGFGSPGVGTGAFAGTLTHHRAKVFGHCVIYSATISGSLTLTPS
jgi:hypothetical protein